MNKPIQVLLCLIFLVLSGDANSQNVKRWSLQECIEYAIAHNFQLAQNTLTVEASEISLLQSKAVALPSLNGWRIYTHNFGRRIDPLTNQFATNRVLSQNFSLSSNVNLFGGLSNTQTIYRIKLAVIAAKYNNDQLKNDISLQVTNSFLQIILADELSNIAIISCG